MYSQFPSFVLGFHGCDLSVAESVFQLLLRDLDCAVINYVHQSRLDEGLQSFDTVRSVFVEGDPLYPTAGFYSKNHIQLCVRNPECIKGYFRPLADPIE